MTMIWFAGRVPGVLRPLFLERPGVAISWETSVCPGFFMAHVCGLDTAA